ncbi:glycosyltransferase [Yoonia litorea]|uniref:Glycosyltransferase involved in cell wall bisynthesis n=1 Tax=Yoonia litorea TaxID=1123755 RepID=A0A1I6N2T5_9RHOB|nr:glycosyltransferase [Yoonia litorea]SFS22250.1 Glycosyltransferase involved in cell wall bisynthesis [Yoonia litorea]
MIEAFAQVRRQVVELCAQKRFTTARLFLVGSGCSVETHTSLWEYIARRSDAHGNTVVARALRKEIWDAGVGSSEIALREVDDALDREDFDAAGFLLESVFGSEPEHQDVRRRLAQSYFRQAAREAGGGGLRLRTDREKALRLAAEFVFQTPDDATVIIDLLRYAGELHLALEKTREARLQFGALLKFDTREARISEQVNDLDRAAVLWEEIADKSETQRGTALLKLANLYERLERESDLKRAQARLALADVSVADRLLLALSSGQAGTAHALSEYVGLSNVGENQLPTAVSISFAEQLLDHGEIGLAVWLRRQRVPVGDRVKRTLDQIGFASGGGTRDLPDTVAEAIEIKSPDFMLPFEKTLKLKPKPKGWPGVGAEPESILLVNASLGIGGAERQFVALVGALLENGFPPDKLHVALFKLERDRRQDYFLPELASHGAVIHDLSEAPAGQFALSSAELRMIDALPRALRSDVRVLLPLVKELQPSVLHGWQDASSAACAIAGTAAGVKRIVLSMRNMSPATRRDKSLVLHEALFKDIMARENVMVTANSRVAADDYADWLDLPKTKFDVVPNAVDFDRYPALPKVMENEVPDRPIHIGGVFRLAINKRPILWLRTIHALRHQEGISLKPFLFGSGPLEKDIVAEAEALGLSDLVMQQGIVDPEAIYGELDVVLLMSQVEGLPNVLLEAQAMGKPVVACEVGGVREAVKLAGKGAGLLLSAHVSPQEAAKQIAAWLPEARKAPPYLIQRHIRETYAPKRLAERSMQIYRGYRLDQA